MSQTPRSHHRVKNNGTHGKVRLQGILMWNIQALALTSFREEDRMTDRTKTISHPIFDRGHKKCMYNYNDLYNNALCLIIFLKSIVYQTIMPKKSTTTVMSYLNRKHTFKILVLPNQNLFNY